MPAVTELLNALQGGRPSRQEEALLPVVYRELRRIAAARMARQAPGQTLQATALVHEAYLKLMGGKGETWENRRHFFGAAARAMSQILVDIARRKQSARRGGEQPHVDITLVELPQPVPPERFIALHDALQRLAAQNPTEAEIVRLRYFTGLETSEVAEMLGLSVRTVARHWVFAKAWLFREMSRPEHAVGRTVEESGAAA